MAETDFFFKGNSEIHIHFPVNSSINHMQVARAISVFAINNSLLGGKNL